jgi:hypothetical protein
MAQKGRQTKAKSSSSDFESGVQSRLSLTVRELALLQDACINWRNYVQSNEVLTPLNKQRADELSDVWLKLFDFFNYNISELTPENEKLVILQDTGVDVDV